MTQQKSLDWWERYGKFVLMASPYKDTVITRAHGCTVVDADGNEYLDLTSGQICALVGHGHPSLVERVRDQMTRVVHTGTSFFTPPVFEASARVAAITPPGLTKSLFLSTGAEANEYAIRLARVCTGKTNVLAMTKGYAGLTLQTSSLTNYGKSAKPLVPGTGYILVPDPTVCPPDRNVLDWSRELLQQSLEVHRALLDDVAAIIVEPILSAGGLIVLPDGYLRDLRQLADRLGALLIADEAQTGMGRTGRWFGVNHDDVTPDVLVLAKGVGGGFPSSVVVTTDAVNDAVMTRANQFSSHQSDPLGAVATAAVIDIIETDGLVARAAALGQVLRERLGEIGARRGHLVNVRGRGLMIGFDVFRDAGRPVVEPDLGRGIEDFCRARGVNFEVIQRNRFRILPPLTISDAEIDRFLTVLDEAMAAIDRGGVRPLAAANTWTAGYEQRLKRERGLRSIAKWAWNHSPSEWIGQVQQLARKAGSRG